MNRITSQVTAFKTYAELLTACQGGYVPSIIIGKRDPLASEKAKLTERLRADGFKVWEGSGLAR